MPRLPDSRLTDKQRKFVEEYLGNGRKGAEAYRAAYNTKCSNQAAAVEACKLLKNPKIAPIIAEAEARAAQGTQRALDKYEVTEERIVAGLARLGFYDARDIFQWSQTGIVLKPSDDISDDAAAAITEISQTLTEAGGTIKVKLADKRAALVDLGKYLGMFIDRREQGGVGEFAKATDDELRAGIAADLAGAQPPAADPPRPKSPAPQRKGKRRARGK